MTRAWGGHIAGAVAGLMAAWGAAPPAPAGAQAFQEQMQLPSGVTRPRTPLGPGLRQQFSVEQTAPAIDDKQSDSGLADLARFVASPAEPTAVRIFSLADVSLAMAWFDPAANTWKTAELPPLEETQVSCAACENVLTVSFFDGLEQREYEWKLGSRWLLKPGPDKRKWVFEDVAALASSGN